MTNDSSLRFAQDKYGDNYDGYIVLFGLPSKLSQSFGVGEQEKLANAIDARKGQENLYLIHSTQREYQGGADRGSNSMALQVPGLFADIDSGADKNKASKYPADKEIALKILKDFALPPSSIIDTGNGIHAHWFFDKNFTITDDGERTHIANVLKAFQRKLKAHFAVHGCDIDSVGDLARATRIPGTYNHKNQPSKPVSLIEHHPSRRYALRLIEDMVKDFLEDAKTLTEALNTSYPPADHERIMTGCDWYGAHVGSAAAQSDEPNWYAAASITGRCKDGEKLFHAYSSQHSGYKEKEAAVKLQRACTEAGPRSCKSIRYDLLGNEKYCSACPQWGKITSPIVLGHKRDRREYEPGNTGPIPLGYDSYDGFIFRNQQTHEVVTKTARDLATAHSLMTLAPNAFWQGQFPKIEKKRIVGIDLPTACDTLIQVSREAGYIDPSRIRGFGIWGEDDAIIRNTGESIITSDSYIYSCPPRRLKLVRADFPIETYLEFLRKPNWVMPAAPMLLLGWSMASIICGALEWRPHAGLTGSAQSGKTTVMKGIGYVLSPAAIIKEGISTEAGIRQSLGFDARPALIDELEPEGPQDIQRIGKIVKLIRSSSSATGEVARGTPGGRALNFSTHCMFLVGAINLYRISAADTSRVVRFEMKPSENARASRTEILDLRDRLCNTGPAFCQMAIDNAEAVLLSIPLLHREMVVMQERHADNMATLLAGYWVALNKRPITQAEAVKLIAEHKDAIEQQAERHQLDDSTECLNALFGHTIIEGAGKPPISIGKMLGYLKGKGDESASHYQEHLANYGIRWENGGFMVANTHPGIQRVYQSTRWHGGLWPDALARLMDAQKLPQKRFADNVRCQCVWIPGNHVEAVNSDNMQLEF